MIHNKQPIIGTYSFEEWREARLANLNERAEKLRASGADADRARIPDDFPADEVFDCNQVDPDDWELMQIEDTVEALEDDENTARSAYELGVSLGMITPPDAEN